MVPLSKDLLAKRDRLLSEGNIEESKGRNKVD